MKKVERGLEEEEEEVVKPYIGNTNAVQAQLDQKGNLLSRDFLRKSKGLKSLV